MNQLTKYFQDSRSCYKTMRALLLMTVIFIHPIIANSADFSLEPTSVIQAEGVVARFFCRHPQTIAFGWMINGTALTLIQPRPPEIKDGSVLLNDGMGGAVSTEALNITALANYNATEIVCVAFLSNGTQDFSSPAILTVQGPIDSPGTLTTSMEVPEKILLSWMPPFSLDLTAVDPDIAYCVDVYNITDGGPFHLSSNCSILWPSYTFSVENPDPKDEFEFTVTPRSNVEGSRNGTRSQITGRFSLQRPLVNGIPIANMLVSVLNNDVDVNIEFTNTAISRAPIRRPENYSVAIQIINPPSNDVIECPTIINFETELSTSLSLSCVQPLRKEQLGLFTIIASNRAGSTTILDKQELSTHYIQNISVTPGDSPGKATVRTYFIDGTNLLGYLAIANGDLNVGYMVARRRCRMNQMDTITNLASSEYNTSIFAVNKDGLPEMFSASLPRNVVITASDMQTVTGGQPSISINVSEVQPTNVGEVCYDCTFLESDVHRNSTCVAIAHPCGVSSLYPGLFNISVTKFTRSGNSARGCIDINQCGQGYYIALMYFNGQRGMIEGLPLAKMSPNKDGDIVTSDNSVDVAVPVVLTLLFTLMIVALVVVVAVFVWKKEMFLRRSYKPRHSPEPGTDNADYDDPSCTISTQDLVESPAETIYHKPVGSPKRSASVECHYAETAIATASSNPQPIDPPPKTEYTDEQQYAMLHNQAPSKEGTPDDIHKVEYSEVNTGPENTIDKRHDQEEESDYEDFSAAAANQDISMFHRSTENTNFDALGSYLTKVQINPEVHEYSY